MTTQSQHETPRVVRLTVPLVPPSVNHYKKPVTFRVSGGGVQKGFAVTPEGKAFKQAVAIFARGQTVSPSTPHQRNQVRYALYVTVYLGEKQRGDGDNFWKCIADGLVDAGVIHSDARVRRWRLDVEDNDRGNPRTEIRAAVIRGGAKRGK